MCQKMHIFKDGQLCVMKEAESQLIREVSVILVLLNCRGDTNKE